MYDGTPSVSQAAYRHLACESAEPWFVSYYNSAAMESFLAELMPRSFDLILIEHSFMARFLPFLRPDVPKVLDMHNVHTLMAWRRAQEKSGSEKDDAVKEFERTQSFERTVCSACQLCLCCSDQDAEAARRFLNIKHLKVIPNGVDTAVMTGGKAPVTPGYLLFTGMMNYEPNLEAVRYFVGEILPLIRAEVPYATFHIAGANPLPEVKALAADSVYIHSSVPDMRPYFHQASVVVVPLLHGGGTRLKILDAAACGKPIVSTSVGAEGLNFVDGRDILVADSPPRFAQAVVKLLSNPDRQADLSRSARRAAEAYDWSDVSSEFCSVMIGIAQGRRGIDCSRKFMETGVTAHRDYGYDS
jgi:glycosyltransferase involved in cell wall biosynthesis